MTIPGGWARSGRVAAAALGLVLLTAWTFRPILGNDFVDLDDPAYIGLNPWVSRGLTPEGLRWALTAVHSGNWHPLTWLSHMADVELWGLSPAGHHGTSLALHAANAVILCLVLAGMTGSLWPSAAAAALFAVHPLHVESVAWVAERKDLLSALGWLAAMGAWAWYARRPGPWRYLAAGASLSLGLAAKAMPVTLPVILLALDWWPLGRLRRTAGGSFPWREAGRLLLEKVPLMAISLLAGGAAVFAQRRGGTIESLSNLGPWGRAATALAAGAGYLWKTVWPLHLAVFYPLDIERPPYGAGLGAAAFLLAVTMLVLVLARRLPFLPIGWFWYGTALLPVSGLVQIGGQRMADRYTYLPLVGIFLAAAWSAAQVARRGRAAARATAAAAGVLILVLAGLARIQAAYWRDTGTLFAHALEATGDNWLAHLKLGNIAMEKGDDRAAAVHFTAALVSRPDLPDAHYNLGVALARQGRLAEGEGHLRRAVAILPGDARFHQGLGVVLAEQGRDAEAAAHLRRALALDPGAAGVRRQLELLLRRAGRGAGTDAAAGRTGVSRGPYGPKTP